MRIIMESKGIVVYEDEGMFYAADEQNVEQFTTEAEAIAAAREVIEMWKRESEE